MDNIFDLLKKPVIDIEERVKETLVKFLKFVPELIKHGNYSARYNKEPLIQNISSFENCSSSSNTFEFNDHVDDTYISRQEYRLMLLSTNFLNILHSCIEILFNYIKLCIIKEDETNYEFLTTIIDLVIKIQGILQKNSYWLQLNQVFYEIEMFLKFLVEALLYLNSSLRICEHGLHIRILLLFKKSAICRNIVIDLIDKKLSCYLHCCQNRVEQNYADLENVSDILIVLNVMLEHKYKPKEEIIKSLIINIHEEKSNRSSNCNRNNLKKMLQILIQFVPGNIKLLIEDCISTLPPERIMMKN